MTDPPANKNFNRLGTKLVENIAGVSLILEKEE
jgi:hypothetical protein